MAYLATGSPGHDLLVRSRREHGVHVVTVSGQADLRGEPWLAPALRRALADTPPALVLDLTALSFCSVQAIGVLAELTSSVAHGGVPVAVVGLSRLNARLWLGTGMAMPVQHTTVARAVAALSQRPDRSDRQPRPDTTPTTVGLRQRALVGLRRATGTIPTTITEARAALRAQPRPRVSGHLPVRRSGDTHPTASPRPAAEGSQVSGDLVSALASLAHTANRDFTVEDMLRGLCVAAVQTLNVQGVGVMLADTDGVRFVHAEPQRIDEVERLQEILQRGPCRDSVTVRNPVVVNDIAASRRWPEFAEASARAQLGAMVAVPLLARDTAWGVLDLYQSTPWAWTAAELSTARMFADIAASYVVMAHDRDRARDAQRELAHLATHDDLTDLPNRALLFDRLEHALTTAERRQAAVAVLYMDLDRFKAINDTLGQVAGDQVLAEAARRLRKTLRENDTLTRLSGDQFVIVCEDLADAPADVDQQLTALGDRITQALRRPPIHAAGVDLSVTASVGVAISTGRPTPQDLIGDADHAMYVAKQRGGGRFVYSNRQGVPAPGTSRSIERELHDALARDEMRLYYQPIVGADLGHPVVAVEALLRWQHPRRGLLDATDFVDLADRSGALGPIGRWAIDQACSQLRTWLDEPGDTSPNQVFLNLSARQLAAPDLDSILTVALRTHEIPAARVGLEIVEDIFVDPLLVPRLQQHHDRGHPLAIDDFGTGYSSLARLVDLPASFAKIDRSIVAGLPHDEARAKLVEAIIVVAHRLDLRVIAEGVEDLDQADALAAAGCDLLQGFHFAHPKPGRELSAPAGPAPMRIGV